ncbi:MAG: hypothetical protein JNK64_39865 [Myxococcales bacterium]|nr:hypothetical protein [Myxococcales bacterium]
MAAPSSPVARRGNPRAGEGWSIVGLIGALALLLFAALLRTAPPPDPMPAHPLRAIGGGLCLLAVVVAATATELLRGDARRRPFISEVLAAYRRTGRGASRSWAAWTGSLLANALMLLGAMVFLLDALRLDGALRLAVVATALTLIAVVVVPLRPVDDPCRVARLTDYGHPVAAAAFYAAAIALSWIARPHLGVAGQVFAALHIASSLALIALAWITSVLEYRGLAGLWPPGLRVLLDVRAGSRARWVRYWQWPTTALAGLALAAGALGL